MEYASERMRNDLEVALQAIHKSVGCWKLLLPQVLENPDLWRTVKRVDWRYSPKRIRWDKQVVLEVMQKASILPDIAPELLDDDEVMRIAISKIPDNLQHASMRIRDNPDMVRLILPNCGYSIQHASERLRGDRDFCLEIIQKSSYAFPHVSPTLQDDESLVRIAVEKSSTALEYASARLRDDTVFMTNILKIRGGSFEHASERLKDDRKVVLCAIKCDGCYSVRKCASRRLLDDREVALALVEHEGDIFGSLGATMRDDEQILRVAMKTHVIAFQEASERLMNDRALSLWAVSLAPNNLPLGCDDKEIVMEAVCRDAFMLELASDRLRRDWDVVDAAVSKWGASIQFALDVSPLTLGQLLDVEQTNLFALRSDEIYDIFSFVDKHFLAKPEEIRGTFEVPDEIESVESWTKVFLAEKWQKVCLLWQALSNQQEQEIIFPRVVDFDLHRQIALATTLLQWAPAMDARKRFELDLENMSW